jgi:hypothetical protein
MGSFPIAQLRQPFSAVQYLAERLDLPHLLKLQHPEQDEEWSAMDICDGTYLLHCLLKLYSSLQDLTLDNSVGKFMR